MLGYNYSLRGVVVLGNMIGRTIGFPTANMQLYEPLKMLPANGVYFVKVSLSSGEYIGICNVGNRPTVGNNNNKTIETHILDFNEDIYGLDIRIEFVARLRDEMKFSSLEQLKERISLDKEFVRNNF
jgi:riboflavin kinase/FMN adenylyltransferase